jgi:hypothetical protein
VGGLVALQCVEEVISLDRDPAQIPHHGLVDKHVAVVTRKIGYATHTIVEVNLK